LAQRSQPNCWACESAYDNPTNPEASPVDNVWGIGLAQDDARANDPGQGEGLNLLGFALMEIRRGL